MRILHASVMLFALTIILIGYMLFMYGNIGRGSIRYQYEKESGPFLAGGESYSVLFSPTGSIIMKGGAEEEGNETRQKILGLNDFYELTLDDPLFYSPYMDTEKLRDSVNMLMETENETLIQFSRWVAYSGLGSSIRMYPDGFLLILPDIISATDEFYASPSYEGAEKLLELYENAVDKYSEDAQSRLEIIGSTANKDTPMLFFGSGTSLRIMESDISLVLENAAELRKEIEKRRACLQQGCSYFPDMNESAAAENPANPGEFSQIPEELLRLYGTDRRGPYIIPSACWGREEGRPLNQLMYLFYTGDSSSRYALTKLATQSYYIDLNQSSSLYSSAMKERGVFIEDQPEGMDYRCTDLGFLRDITTLDFFIQKLRESRIFEGVSMPINMEPELQELSEAVAAGKGLETSLMEDQYPDSSDMKALGKLYSKAYKILRVLERRYPPEQLDTVTGGLSRKTDTLRKYTQLLGNRFVMLPEMVREIRTSLELFRITNMINDQPQHLEYTFGIRSCYSLVYLPSAGSAWRLEKEPEYLLQENFNLTQFYLTYTGLVERGYSLEDIKGFYHRDRATALSIAEEIKSAV